jgi:hypothetical protein
VASLRKEWGEAFLQCNTNIKFRTEYKYEYRIYCIHANITTKNLLPMDEEIFTSILLSDLQNVGVYLP